MATVIELDPAMEQRLEHLAQATGHSKQVFLQELIAHGMDEIEDIYLAGAELERLQRGESSTRSLDAVSAELGLDD